MNIVSWTACSYVCGLIFLMFECHAMVGTFIPNPDTFQPLITRIDGLQVHIDQAHQKSVADINALLDTVCKEYRAHMRVFLAGLVCLTLGYGVGKLIGMGVQYAVKPSDTPSSGVTWYPSNGLMQTWYHWWSGVPDYDAVAREVVISPENLDYVRQILWAYQLPDQPGARFPIVLIHGPAGSGKTTLAQAIAQACRVPFCRLHAGALVTHDVHEAAMVIKNFFKHAQAMNPCMLIIDDAELLLAPRHTVRNEYDCLVYLFLQELENLSHAGALIFVANDVRMIDTAIQDRININISMNYPDYTARLALIRRYLEQAKLDPDILQAVIRYFAQGSAGVSGRHLRHVVEHWVRCYHALADAALRPDILEQCLHLHVV